MLAEKDVWKIYDTLVDDLERNVKEDSALKKINISFKICEKIDLIRQILELK